MMIRTVIQGKVNAALILCYFLDEPTYLLLLSIGLDAKEFPYKTMSTKSA